MVSVSWSRKVVEMVSFQSSLLLLVLATLSVADIPVDCHYDSIVGQWKFYESSATGKVKPDCSKFKIGDHKHIRNLTLSYPNIVRDDFGNEGTWTLVYNQGFEVRVAGRSYFAFSKFSESYDTVTSYCGETLPASARDLTVRNWSCYVGKKVNPPKPSVSKKSPRSRFLEKRRIGNDKALVERINREQSDWTATVYPQFENLTLGQAIKMAGPQRIFHPDQRGPKKLPVPLRTKLRAQMLPKQFDWRNVSGFNYVPPVRDQGSCGSCYAYASTGMMDSQILIHSNRSKRIYFSVEDILKCSHLSQGCEGGFAYLVGGRYAQDSGLVGNECFDYDFMPHQLIKCSDRESCPKTFTLDYQYVGGYYGACSEEAMREALVKNGPIAIGFKVSREFLHYKKGIYSPFSTTKNTDKFDPFELTSHAVLIVGYGETEEGAKYWTLQNSWGQNWGDGGYFYLKRGEDTAGVESSAVTIVAY